MAVRWFYLSCNQFSVAVAVDEQNIIREAPPIAARFVGQPSENLGRFMRRIGGFKGEPLPAVGVLTAHERTILHDLVTLLNAREI